MAVNHTGFCMLAGTVRTCLGMDELRLLLRQGGVEAEIEGDELKIRQQATVVFRPGFDHELILVGDAREQHPLMVSVEQVSSLLRGSDIQHAYEIYDSENILVHEYEFQP